MTMKPRKERKKKRKQTEKARKAKSKYAPCPTPIIIMGVEVGVCGQRITRRSVCQECLRRGR